MNGKEELHQQIVIDDGKSSNNSSRCEHSKSSFNDNNVDLSVDSAESNKGEARFIEDNAIIVDNQSYREATLYAAQQEELSTQKKRSGILFPTIFILITVLISIEFYRFIESNLVQSPVVTGIYILLFICVCFAFTRLFIKELYGLYQLKKQQHIRAGVVELIDSPINKTKLSAKQACEYIQQQLVYELPPKVEQEWQSHLANNISEQELIEVFDRQVLSHVDKKAVNDIAKYSSETMLLVAISPLAFIDMFIVFWRNIKMINKISGLYGLKLGYWSRIKLIKQVFGDMLLVGASELAIDLGSQALGADILGKLSGRMAQGFGAGMLTARLGINALKASRPMPFTEQAPQLSNIRNALLNNIKTSLLKKNEE